MLKSFLIYFFGLFAIVDPAGAVPIWIALTKTCTESSRKSLARQTVSYVFSILIGFLFVGTAILRFFNISLLGLRIAGGVMLIIYALDFLRPEKGEIRRATETDRTNIAFTPMAMPLLSGPGAIAVILGIGGDLGYVWRAPLPYVSAILAIMLICLAIYLVLYFSDYILKILGDSFLHGMTLFMAFFLLCIGVQFIVDSGTEILRSIH